MDKLPWRMADKDEINNMSYKDMVNVLEGMIEESKNEDAYARPRSHLVKIFKTSVELMKKEMDNHKYDEKYWKESDYYK